MTPLQISCKHDNDSVAELIINHDMDIEKLLTSNFPLHLICKSKIEKIHLVNLTLLKFKLAQANNAKAYLEQALSKLDSNKQTILHISVENNHLNIVELLFRDFNINKLLKDGKNGNLAIHLVAKTGSLKMLDILHKYDAVFNYRNNNLGKFYFIFF
jgi:ankyrin repeat protein